MCRLANYLCVSIRTSVNSLLFLSSFLHTIINEDNVKNEALTDVIRRLASITYPAVHSGGSKGNLSHYDIGLAIKIACRNIDVLQIHTRVLNNDCTF